MGTARESWWRKSLEAAGWRRWLGVGLVALRHSSYGRRLSAMKDSPAACATLGQNPLRLKLSVFMLSAAIILVGGSLRILSGYLPGRRR